MSLYSDLICLPLDQQQRLVPCLGMLQQAHDAAQHRKHDPWDFAVCIEELFPCGVNATDLRYLLDCGIILGAVEQSDPDVAGRTFRPLQNLQLRAPISVVLAPGNNAELAQWRTSVRVAVELPCWNEATGELTLGGVLLKRLKVSAINQRCVLDVFQEEGWPERIDAPLPLSGEDDTQPYLGYTIRRLNSSLLRPLLRFCKDSTGEGIRWERGRLVAGVG
jgi:hypothetical protein